MKSSISALICLCLLSCNESNSKIKKVSLSPKPADSNYKIIQTVKPIIKKPKLPEILTDIDGNKYKTVNIGGQTWMAENLRVTRYRNGDSIEYNRLKDWEENTIQYYYVERKKDEGYWFYADNDKNTDSLFGKLYNWYAINDSRNIAPNGWHVPNATDYLRLMKYMIDKYGSLKGETIMANSILWYNHVIGGDYNNTGFSAIPVGTHNDHTAIFWTSTLFDTRFGAYYFSVDWRGEIGENIHGDLSYQRTDSPTSCRLIKN